MGLKPGSGQVGFLQVPEGEGILLELSGKVEAIESKEDTFRVEFLWCEDNSATISLFCDLTKKGGLQSLLDVVYFSGAYKDIQKKSTKLGDLDKGEEWDEDVMKSQGFINQFRLCGKGKRILADIKASKGKDKEGNEREYRNIVKIYAADDAQGATAETAEEEMNDI